MDQKSNQPFVSIIGSELSSIEFVRDYIQFRFDGPCLTAITDPYILIDGERYNRGDTGYNDMLLHFIGQAIINVLLIENNVLSLYFSQQKSINISLDPKDIVTVEAVTYRDSSGNLWIW